MAFEKVLIVDDERELRSSHAAFLSQRGFSVSTAGSCQEAEAAMGREFFDLVLLELRLPDGDGHLLLEHLMALPERPLVIVATGFGSIESAVSCMRAGAFEYLLKPFTSGQLDLVLKRAQAFQHLVQVNKVLSDQVSADVESAFVGRSPAMVRLRQLIERVAPTEATVFITGENGTGKEMVAQELYRRSTRRPNAFIKVNCAAVSENLIESEFFGHERGAFTGATERREGRFELAHQGTLLLDEVSEIPPNLQAKLLRVLQEREFERVGGNRTIKVNVRILATSNRDLITYVEKGSFRQDLYYRLNVFPVHVPSLRERVEDIQPLAEHFLGRFSRKLGIKVAGFSESARRLMLSYRWPGNVRELQNTIERAVILTEPGRAISAPALGLPAGDRVTRSGQLEFAQPIFSGDRLAESVFGVKVDPAPSAVAEDQETDDTVTEETGPRESAAGGAFTTAGLNLAALEKIAILQALDQTKGNRTQAAQVLGISIRTLRNKLQEYRETSDRLGTAG
jgi:DNA-binding NtrC family response regulator